MSEERELSFTEEEYLRHRAYCLTYEISDAINDGNFDRADALRDAQDAIRDRIYGKEESR